MTENKQIAIYDLLPLLKPGWVAMDELDEWEWYPERPYIDTDGNMWDSNRDPINLSRIFNILPFEGDWKDSLMEVRG